MKSFHFHPRISFDGMNILSVYYFYYIYIFILSMYLIVRRLISSFIAYFFDFVIFLSISFFSGDKVLMHMSETGRKPPVFSEASFIAGEILDSGFEFDAGEMFYNEFKYVCLCYNPSLDVEWKWFEPQHVELVFLFRVFSVAAGHFIYRSDYL